jgi:hypothetical protein
MMMAANFGPKKRQSWGRSNLQNKHFQNEDPRERTSGRNLIERWIEEGRNGIQAKLSDLFQQFPWDNWSVLGLSKYSIDYSGNVSGCGNHNQDLPSTKEISVRTVLKSDGTIQKARARIGKLCTKVIT